MFRQAIRGVAALLFGVIGIASQDAAAAYVEVTPGAGGVTASTSDTNVPANTVDNNLTTRWSGNGDGAWIQYDLGTQKTISYVKIAVYTGNARINTFDLQWSNGSGVWTNIQTGLHNSGTTTNEETYDFPDVSARYIRYVGHMSNVGTFNSVTEVSIWQSSGGGPTPTPTPSTTNLALNQPATASSVWSATYVAGKAVDGTTTTSRWSSASGMINNQWLAVDLGAGTTYGRVVIKEVTLPRVTSYVLQSSNDGTTYANIAGTAGTTIGAAKTITFSPVSARYIRLMINTASAEPTIDELEVYTN